QTIRGNHPLRRERAPLRRTSSHARPRRGAAMTQALFFRPSWERLRPQIEAAAPALDVVLYDEDGRLWHQGAEVGRDAIAPAWFWLHSELFFSPRLKDYFQLLLDCPSARWLHTVN